MTAARAIGVDVGGTKLLAAVVAADGSIVAAREQPTPVSSQDDLLHALERAVEDLLGAHAGLAGVGLGVPSRVDQLSGRALGSVNVPLADVALKDRLEVRFGVPVAVENDANAAAFAESKLGAGRGARDMVLLTLGTGVGGGVVLSGSLYRGWAELGHIVIEHDGPPCGGTCTGRGHLESFASGRVADAAARDLLGERASARDLIRHAREGDADARRALCDIGRYLGSGIGSLVNIFNPELVVVGGGFAAAGDLLLDAAREVVRREALPPASDRVRIVPAQLGAKAGVIGAALIALEASGAAR